MIPVELRYRVGLARLLERELWRFHSAQVAIHV